MDNILLEADKSSGNLLETKLIGGIRNGSTLVYFVKAVDIGQISQDH